MNPNPKISKSHLPESRASARARMATTTQPNTGTKTPPCSKSTSGHYSEAPWEDAVRDVHKLSTAELIYYLGPAQLVRFMDTTFSFLLNISNLNRLTFVFIPLCDVC